MRAILIVALSAACGGEREAVRTQAPVAAVDECKTAALKLAVAPPLPGGPRASFSFTWRGEGTGERSRFVCVTAGSEQQLVRRGEHHELAIRADAHELQRIVVDGRPHLLYVPPGSEIVLGDNPCFFYELSGPHTYAWALDGSRAYCAKPGAPCKQGYVRPGGPRPVQDELCGSTEHEIRRCVSEGEVRLEARDAPATRSSDDHLSLADLVKGVRLSPRDCGFALVDTGREEVALVIGSGEHWLLAIDDDRLVGRVR